MKIFKYGKNLEELKKNVVFNPFLVWVSTGYPKTRFSGIQPITKLGRPLKDLLTSRVVFYCAVKIAHCPIL